MYRASYRLVFFSGSASVRVFAGSEPDCFAYLAGALRNGIWKTCETAVQLLRERMERVQFSGRRGWISGGHRGGDRAGVRGAARLGAERLWTCVGVEFAGGRRGIFVLQFSAGENIYEGFREHGAGVQRGISGLGFR